MRIRRGSRRNTASSRSNGLPCIIPGSAASKGCSALTIPIGGSYDNDSLISGAFQTVHLLHKLSDNPSMRHGTPTFPIRHAGSEERINLVNEDYSGRQATSQGEHATDEFFALSDILRKGSTGLGWRRDRTRIACSPYP
jgi:hypothetical protein